MISCPTRIDIVFSGSLLCFSLVLVQALEVSCDVCIHVSRYQFVGCYVGELSNIRTHYFKLRNNYSITSGELFDSSAGVKT